MGEVRGSELVDGVFTKERPSQSNSYKMNGFKEAAPFIVAATAPLFLVIGLATFMAHKAEAQVYGGGYRYHNNSSNSYRYNPHSQSPSNDYWTHRRNGYGGNQYTRGNKYTSPRYNRQCVGACR